MREQQEDQAEWEVKKRRGNVQKMFNNILQRGGRLQDRWQEDKDGVRNRRKGEKLSKESK